MAGLGHNFQFRQEPPEAQHLTTFTEAGQDLTDHMGGEWQSFGPAIVTSFRHESGRVIVNLSRQYDGTSIVVKVNFHHPVTSTGQAIQVLRGEGGNGRMASNLELARNLLQHVYGDIQL